MDLTRRYLETLKAALLNDIYPEAEAERAYLLKCLAGEAAFDPQAFYTRAIADPKLMEAIAESHRTGRHLEGRLKYATLGATMIGRARLDNIETCLEAVLADAIPGDFVECGVWRGGAAAFAKGMLDAHGDQRAVWLADSFEGLPPPTHAEDSVDLSAQKYPMLAVGQPEVEALFMRLGLLDHQVRFLKGWFHETLPEAPIERIAVLRLDGDYYESTLTPLEALYDKVPAGGFVIIDDYGLLEPCRRAVDQFRTTRNITEPLNAIDASGVFWRKA